LTIGYDNTTVKTNTDFIPAALPAGSFGIDFPTTFAAAPAVSGDWTTAFSAMANISPTFNYGSIGLGTPSNTASAAVASATNVPTGVAVVQGSWANSILNWAQNFNILDPSSFGKAFSGGNAAGSVSQATADQMTANNPINKALNAVTGAASDAATGTSDPISNAISNITTWITSNVAGIAIALMAILFLFTGVFSFIPHRTIAISGGINPRLRMGAA